MKPAMRLALIAASAALAAAPAFAGGVISYDRSETQTNGDIKVTSSAFKDGDAIPLKYSAFGQSVSPQLSWTAAPNAKSYVVLVDDPDGGGAQPVSHWVDWNIPTDTTTLPEGAKAGVQGTNSHQSVGYVGPHPPTKDDAHHYHFQVLAVDRTIDLPAGADREAVLTAIQGHVIAKGEVVGAFRAPQPKSD
ncbi:YbhB/YbcL family Raf kinase inhibitor-like protein [Phenylobacterium sp.]|uniref:YbhB/YbcL family Raf kinase inhibitor-like protein n=1 Tax=Phenylobacterium sp. TaxID=1871053 RepID=UPI0011FF042B|nr:YbhB/YbcL family Raf kinase inhibitor-like protein [Phenylobacterium sp.]THD64377.1 MAG: YbhB/YbcL family Raf kinase inhibitor-like protein [Phenylobacterium sp.]